MVTQILQPATQMTIKKIQYQRQAKLKNIYTTEKCSTLTGWKPVCCVEGMEGRKALSGRERKFSQACQYKQLKLTCGLT